MVRRIPKDSTVDSEAPMKTLTTRYLERLESDVEFLRQQLREARADLEFYRGKVERLELSMMNAGMLGGAAAQQYAQMAAGAPTPNMLQQGPPAPLLSGVQSQLHVGLAPSRMPFSEIKRKWMALSEEEQARAMEQGFKVDEKEESDAGS
jgi:hypothetical protein